MPNDPSGRFAGKSCGLETGGNGGRKRAHRNRAAQRPRSRQERHSELKPVRKTTGAALAATAAPAGRAARCCGGTCSGSYRASGMLAATHQQSCALMYRTRMLGKHAARQERYTSWGRGKSRL
jgi:hypothetical protein